MAVKPIPDGYSTLTPYLVIDGASRAIDFYRRAFGATELFRMGGPDGRVGHAELQIGQLVQDAHRRAPHQGHLVHLPAREEKAPPGEQVEVAASPSGRHLKTSSAILGAADRSRR